MQELCHPILLAGLPREIGSCGEGVGMRVESDLQMTQNPLRDSLSQGARQGFLFVISNCSMTPAWTGSVVWNHTLFLIPLPVTSTGHSLRKCLLWHFGVSNQN